MIKAKQIQQKNSALVQDFSSPTPIDGIKSNLSFAGSRQQKIMRGSDKECGEQAVNEDMQLIMSQMDELRRRVYTTNPQPRSNQLNKAQQYNKNIFDGSDKQLFNGVSSTLSTTKGCTTSFSTQQQQNHYISNYSRHQLPFKQKMAMAYRSESIGQEHRNKNKNSFMSAQFMQNAQALRNENMKKIYNIYSNNIRASKNFYNSDAFTMIPQQQPELRNIFKQDNFQQPITQQINDNDFIIQNQDQTEKPEVDWTSVKSEDVKQKPQLQVNTENKNDDKLRVQNAKTTSPLSSASEEVLDGPLMLNANANLNAVINQERPPDRQEQRHQKPADQTESPDEFQEPSQQINLQIKNDDDENQGHTSQSKIEDIDEEDVDAQFYKEIRESSQKGDDTSSDGDADETNAAKMALIKQKVEQYKQESDDYEDDDYEYEQEENYTPLNKNNQQKEVIQLDESDDEEYEMDDFNETPQKEKLIVS